MAIEVGQQAPDFTGIATNGDTVTLSDYKDKHVVLYFYPKDMTPGCTTEACDFRDQSEAFADLNTVILGVSPDPVEKHKKFTEKHGLPFLLLADENHEVAEKYDAWKLKKMFGKEYMGIQRSTVVIDKDGKIAKKWPKVKVKGHVEEALQYIKENL